MQKISSFITPVLLAILIGVVGHDHYFGVPIKDGTVTTVHDATVVKLGKDYHTAISSTLVQPLDSVATGTFSDFGELTKAQHDALDKALTAAYTPIAAELEKRFGKAEAANLKPDMAGVKSFFADLSYGFKSK